MPTWAALIRAKSFFHIYVQVLLGLGQPIRFENPPQGLKVLQCKIFAALVPLQCTGPWAKFPRQGVLGIRKLGIFIAKWELGGQLGSARTRSALL